MKKMFCLVLALVLSAGLAGCTGTDGTTATVPSSSEAGNQSQTAVTTSGPADPSLPVAFSPPFMDLVMDAPDYTKVSEANGKMFKTDTFYVVLFTKGEPAAVDNADIVDYYTADFIVCANYSHMYDLMSIGADTTEDLTIGGYSVMRFEGLSVMLFEGAVKREYKCFTVGYTFSFDGIPCMLIGIVNDEAQNAADIAQVTKDIDGMMRSIRRK